MNINKIKKMIVNAVQKGEHCQPKFYVVGGSDIYGFKSEKNSDIDIRGFHIAPSERFLELRTPKEQIIINQGCITQGYEGFEGMELVSYELRKFGQMILKMNFNILEWLYHGKPIMNGIPLDIDFLRKGIKTELPGDVPYHYLGMSRQNYAKFLDSYKENYRPTAKKYLYVLRGLLAAIYTMETGCIEPDIRKLTDHHIVKDLIKVKLSTEDAQCDALLQEKAKTLILALFDDVEKSERKAPSPEFEGYINRWMNGIRTRGD